MKIGVIAFLLVCWMGVSFNGMSQTYAHIEFENLSTPRQQSWFGPQINILGTSLAKDAKFGAYFFSLLNQHWGQAYGGLQYRPADWLILRAGAGLETDSFPLRVNFTALMLLNRFTFLQVYEHGGSGFWYNIILNYSVSQHFKAGAILKRYYGLGLNFEYSIPGSPVTFNLAPLYDFEFNEPRVMGVFRFAL